MVRVRLLCPWRDHGQNEQKLEIGAKKRHGSLLSSAGGKLGLLHMHEILIYFYINEVRTCGVFLVLSEDPELIFSPVIKEELHAQ